VNRWVVFILRPMAAAVIGLALFRGLRPAAELCALSIRTRWPAAWFSSFIVWDADFLALLFSIVVAVVVVQYTFKRISN
jgi:hypothetical protein